MAVLVWGLIALSRARKKEQALGGNDVFLSGGSRHFVNVSPCKANQKITKRLTPSTAVISWIRF